MDNVIKVCNITKRFNDKLVLDNISFEVKKGDIFGFIGPNGAGKSTLINIMTGLLTPNSGDIKLYGHSILKEPVEAKKLIGLVPQELALMETFSALDNLMYFGAFYGLHGKKLRQRIDEVLEVTGLSERKNDKVKKFSGGMKRRLNLAIAIIHNPEILIMDEPTVGVDPQSRNCIFEYIRKVNKEQNTTIIYTSHYMEEVELICKDIFILDSGKEVARGSKHEIKTLSNMNGTVQLKVDSFDDRFILSLQKIEGVRNVFLEDDVIKILVDEWKFQIKDLLDKVVEENKKIIDFKKNEASLEEVFLSLTGKKLRD
ncbi:ABC transporter ATP-binding protein [Clostridium felsineum]|uniref:ABC transporter ATP-binding protein n=1 Tax=Clostridium felsineum TaxID=36839 RepID=UPI00098C11EF|nr:ABC transporter ATP-binding protein [Clostridium felsineum]URZ17383.1 Linearmycin resistance ATP-binding protein LnrL [Clostridium felsineum DSM 794]